MTSGRGEVYSILTESAKRPKLQRACDLCRKKKSDGSEMPSSRCSKCISYGVECTYEAVSRRPPTKSYVEILENRLQKMEELFDRLQPHARTSLQDANRSWGSGAGLLSPEHALHTSPSASVALPLFNVPPTPESDELDPSDDELEASKKLVHSFRKFSLRPNTMRYHGKSSSMMLLQAAVDMKYECTGVQPHDCIPEPTESLSEEHQTALMSFADDLPPYRNFPPPDLMATLINAYFTELNVYVPLLHHPTFEARVKAGLHLEDEGFGAVVLLVCSIGSRWVEDPRLEPYGLPQMPGWKWFLQVERARKSIFGPPRLTDLQKCVLMAMYLGGNGSSHNCWTLIGMGMRAAQDMGAHRKKTYASLSKAEAEECKRAFWSLVMFDRISSFNLGRPCALQDEDHDCEPLLECDDEYWDTGNPDTDFKQPANKPSMVAFLNCLNRLLQILAFALRTIYSINKSKLLLGFVGQEWEERIVAELDSLLNKWIDTVPDHLRWDPHRESIPFLNQSAVLYEKYYQLQIFVHRPFLPFSRKSSRLTLPSLAICTNAARSCVHISSVQFRRVGKPLVFSRMPLFTAGIVLLINMWGGKRIGLSNTSAAADVQKCMTMLKQIEVHYNSRAAGRLMDILHSLYSAGDFKAAESELEEPSRKRARDSDQPGVPSPSTEDSSSLTATQLPSIHTSAQTHTSTSSQSHTDSENALSENPNSESPQTTIGWAEPNDGLLPVSFDLPVRTEDLGRVPFNYGFSPFFDALFPPEQQPGLHQAPINDMEGDNMMQLQPSVEARCTAPPSAINAPPVNEYQQFNIGSGSTPVPTGSSYGPTQQPTQAPGVATQASAFQFPFTFPVPSQPQNMSTIGPAAPPKASNGPMPPLSVEDLALADNALDMWSSAPTSLDWGDWGVFVNNVSGGGAADWPSEAQF
ncbi:fungal-specific transcription factor domain-containing protein [Trametes gibbosa]|nr:fungal-specific transcription factor domain-containing protein [Trametes gibbosa]UVI59149.1 Zn(2)-Cys(6)51 [Trametes gibbosa]